ncbi:MAG TPA: NADH-quinone oxidoreductase subunit N [Conexivisphaerales archaeon]|nr:NADH-quinone oxidoreductase subunit N [Conexivisphaerales archaeon]
MLITIATLAIPALLIPMLSALGLKWKRFPEVATVAALFVAMMELPFVLLYSASASPQSSIWSYPSNLLSFDGISFIFCVTVILVSMMVAISSSTMLDDDSNKPVYYSLLLFATLGMVLVSSTADLIFLLVSWELMTVPSFLLVALKKRDPKANEAAVKFFLAAALSSALILYGISLFYGVSGSTSLYVLQSSLASLPASSSPVILLATSFLLGGFAVKMALAPFHFWLPDTLEGAHPPVAALLAAGSKKAGFAAALRVVVFLVLASRFVSVGPSWQIALAIMAAVTMTWGNLAALTQKSLPRLLAYSSIAQAGYIMIGLAVQGTAGAVFGLLGLLLHVLFHAVMKGSAFISLRNIGSSMDDLAGLYKKAPLMALSFVVSLFALAGLPPLNGFWSKLFLFMGAVQGGMSWLAAVALINSAVALGYYSYLAKRMFFDDPVTPGVKVQQPDVLAVALFALIFIVVTGLYPEPLIRLISLLTS